MANLKFAILGTGFWAHFQLAGWMELGGLECVALYNRTRSKAEALAQKFNVPQVYDTAEELFDKEKLDFVDIITDVGTHSSLTHTAAERGFNIVCQKPMATTLEEAHSMVDACHKAGVQLLINENWRWQHPIRQFKQILDDGKIGRPFRARVHYCNSFPVFDNQPFLKDAEQFILADIGSHILDTARYLFGNATSLYCHTTRVHPDIKGEDVATVMMQMGDGISVVCEMSYASRTEIEHFPQTYVYVEGDKGYLELGPDYKVRETTSDGTHIRQFVPPHYSWADPAYDLVHASIVDCQRDLLQHLRGKKIAETTGEDNLKTAEMVFGSYQSAAAGTPVHF
ncbi:MAG: gfo/Idh/MocA family oxidoreductase [Anaerolineaceae bacterium]|nr:gfo/Idh/MocA family oxidoreductase [Anaerolineaceae bacterium]